MKRHAGTGSTAPAWIGEQIRLHEEAWPPRVLAVALAGVAAATLVLLGILWSAGPVVYYALP